MGKKEKHIYLIFISTQTACALSTVTDKYTKDKNDNLNYIVLLRAEKASFEKHRFERMRSKHNKYRK